MILQTILADVADGLMGVMSGKVPADSVNIADSLRIHQENAMQELIKDPEGFLEHMIESGIQFGLKLLAAILIYLIGAWLIRRITGMMDKGFLKKRTEPTVASFSKSLVSIFLTILLVIITVSTLGVNTTSIAALLAGGGMAIGLALNGTVQNFAGGIMILIFKPFQVGDYIKASGYEGYVTEVTIVNTKIRTYAGAIIVLPNGSLFGSNVENATEKPVHRCTWKVDVAYGSDSDKVIGVLKQIVGNEPRIIDHNTPGAADPQYYLTALKDSSVEFTIWAWVKTEDYWAVLLKLNKEIYDELPKNGIEFPFPQLDVHLDKKES